MLSQLVPKNESIYQQQQEPFFYSGHPLDKLIQNLEQFTTLIFSQSYITL